MDFKSLMAARIAKSKTSNGASATSKYQRKADLERQREAGYQVEQARLESERQERQAKKRKLEDEDRDKEAIREEKRRKLAEEQRRIRDEREAEEERVRRKRIGLPERPPSGTPDLEPDLEDDELRSKLKDLGESEEVEDGESHEQRLARYYATLKKRKELAKRRTWYPGPIPTTIEPLPADELILPEKPAKPEDDRESYVKLHRQISGYLNFVLREWDKALSGRSKEDAQSSAGTTATKNFEIAKEDLKPLMRRLEAGFHNPPTSSAPVKSDLLTTQQPLPYTALLTPLTSILHLTQKRHYRDAVDAYLRLSIGKAAWPIGVTMVGIHERSAREKLHEDKNDQGAQIMSDEGTRKWLQSLKRLVSFAQTRWEVWDLGQLMG